MKKSLFIKTSDEETKNSLIKSGFKLISYKNGIYTFLNDNTSHFSDNQKVHYSNMLNM